jgi:hypothetical protein
MNSIKKEEKYKTDITCLECKAKFDIWLVNSNFPMDIEEKVRKRFYNYCGACKKYEKYSDAEKDKKGRTKQV